MSECDSGRCCGHAVITVSYLTPEPVLARGRGGGVCAPSPQGPRSVQQAHRSNLWVTRAHAKLCMHRKGSLNGSLV